MHHLRYATREQARQEISEYIEIFHNRQRAIRGRGIARLPRLPNSGLVNSWRREASTYGVHLLTTEVIYQ